MLRVTAGWIALALVAVLIAAAAVYLWDMNLAYERVRARGTVIPSPYGDIEYTAAGSGAPVLVIHGSGGGYDQGELIAQAVIGDELRWIVPSRFGYLRSTFRDGATFDDQAHAYAHLLDHLGVKKVAVVALSHGGPSALLFALLYPERVSSLTLISCGAASSTELEQADANEKGDTLTTIFQYDPLYWGISKLFKQSLMKLLGANDTVIASLAPEQHLLVDRLIDYMNPVAPRSAGVAFDNTAAMPNERIAAIHVPTLIFHARDDGLQLYHNAEFAAANIPGAILRAFDKGGHLLLAVEQPAIRAAAQRFILANIDE
ncbi:MAG: alpha/beta hydrolase [Proteobacteria bacterium]|nr:MAG: alpha/beta hydrolase [Pseudomonadota bacterium]QKK11555.1 MAG: alpha/beta hydrolase [Pseudomonadota bacterium]